MQQERLITCNKNNGKLYGRENELKLLSDAFSSIPKQQRGAQCVFVGGASGTGKSALIQRAFVSKECLYGSGKFEQRGQAKPHAALAHCIADICNQAYEENASSCKTALTEQLDQESLDTLIEAFPEIGTLTDVRSTQQTPATADNRRRGSKQGLEKLKYSLRLFLRAICLANGPVVMCLDDLHWIDHSSLSILQSVLADSELKNLLLVGSYRDNECPDELLEWMDGMENAKRITIGDLRVEDIQTLLLDLLRVNVVDDLAQLVHSQTNGNIFHMLNLIDYMQSEGLLEYSLTKFRWTWDIEKLRENTSLSDNVADIVASRLDRLSPQTLDCLKRCGCLSFRFDQDILYEVEDSLDGETIDTCSSLEEAVQEGILERLQGNRLKFTHDRIYQAALRLISTDEEREAVHLSMGKILWKESGLGDLRVVQDVDDRRLFVCINQLNLGRGLIHENAFRVQLARLNCEASKRAALLSAFVPSLEYLQTGIELLDPASRWQEHGELVLEMYTSMAEMSFCAGRIEQSQDAVKEVLQHTSSIDDSLRAYLVLIQSLSAQAKYAAQVETSLEVLEKLGERVPAKPNSFFNKQIFGRTRRLLQDKSDEEILSLPIMQNAHKAAAIQVMADSMMTLDQVGRWDIITWCICRMIRLTFDFGLAPYSALAFALAAQLFVASEQNDVDAGCRFAKLSMALLQKQDAGRTSARVSLHSGFALHWREPLSIIVDYWIDGHQRGMRDGDINAAMQNITGYGVAYFYSGLPLDSFVNDLENFCSLMNDYGQKTMLLANVPVYQCVLNLTGQSDQVIDISHGKAMDYRKELDFESHRTGEEAEWSFQMQIAFYCEEYELATVMANKVESLNPGATRALPLYHARVFFFCLIAIHNAKQTRKRQFKAKAKKYYNMIQGWVAKQKAINVVHKYQILRAQMATLDSKKQQQDQKLTALFDKAIAASIKSGFLQDAALAAQLASHAVEDKEESRQYFLRSCELYRSWDAHGVADHLERSSKRHGRRVLRRSSEGSAMSHNSSSFRPGYRSRERFDKSFSIKHSSLELDGLEGSSTSLGDLDGSAASLGHPHGSTTSLSTLKESE